MDGVVGSRLGRSSSRYGGTTTTQAQGSTSTFTGPVRKWRRQWVTSDSEPDSNTNNNNANKGKHQNLQHQDATRPLLLCRWIPVPSTASAAADSDLPPKRKVRYAPVTVLEELKKEACTAAGVDAANKVKESEAKLFGKSHYTDDYAFVQDSKGLMMEHAQVNSQPFLDKF